MNRHSGRASSLISLTVAVAVVGLTLSVALAAGAPTQAKRPGDGKELTQIYGSPLAQYFQGAILQIGLERMGYKFPDRVKTVSPPIETLQVATGRADFVADLWVPLHNPLINKVKSRVTVSGAVVKGAQQGYLIDKKTAAKYNIKYVEQLRDPKVAKLFVQGNVSGDKAALIGCDAGWGCESVINYHLKAYGLENTVKHVQGSYNVLFQGNVVTRFRQGNPVLYYTWTPNYTTAALKPGKDVVWLRVKKDHCPPPAPTNCTTNPAGGGINTGWQTNNIHVVANTKFLNDNPAAKKWFSLVKVPIADVNSEYRRLQKRPSATEKTVYKDAQRWVRQHRAQFNKWLAQALQAR